MQLFMSLEHIQTNTTAPYKDSVFSSSHIFRIFFYPLCTPSIRYLIFSHRKYHLLEQNSNITTPALISVSTSIVSPAAHSVCSSASPIPLRSHACMNADTFSPHLNPNPLSNPSISKDLVSPFSKVLIINLKSVFIISFPPNVINHPVILSHYYKGLLKMLPASDFSSLQSVLCTFFSFIYSLMLLKVFMRLYAQC